MIAVETLLQELLEEPVEKRARPACGRVAGEHLIFAGAFVSGMLQLLLLRHPIFHTIESMAVARSLAAGHGFANPFDVMQTGPSAHLAPLFPALMSLLLRLFGDGSGPAFAAGGLCVAVFAAQLALLPRLSHLLFDDPRAGYCAATFAIFWPSMWLTPEWESNYAALAAMAFCLASARIADCGLPALTRGLAIGIMAGAALLLNPALIIVCGAWMAFLLCLRGGIRNPAAVALWCTLGAGLACAPWVARNYAQLGGVFFLRDNLGLELYASNADCAGPIGEVNFEHPCTIRLHPNHGIAQAQAVKDMGELAYNRSRMLAAVNWIRSHPEQFGQLTWGRIRDFWFPEPRTDRPYRYDRGGTAIYQYSVWVITALSLPGLWIAARLRKKSVWFLAATLLLYPLLYYVIQASPRYRVPILWISLLLAGLALQRGAEWACSLVRGRRLHTL